ncbi:hypothetical protein [uncultured Flavobacterium sp.]|tara:strand:+ start:32006 stop:32128 length:123 start_codon:yes stop_codon:yes gene_type:complete
MKTKAKELDKILDKKNLSEEQRLQIEKKKELLSNDKPITK